MIDEAARILKKIEDIIDPHTQGNILEISSYMDIQVLLPPFTRFLGYQAAKPG